MAKIRSIVKPFPPVRRKNWKKKKLLTVLDNRRQWDREFDPVATVDVEIITGEGYGINLEQSGQSVPTYIIREQE